MTLLEQWEKLAFETSRTQEEQSLFWSRYGNNEKSIYESLLMIEKHPILDTFQNFANKFNVDNITMMGFLHGINDSLKTPNDINNISEDTIITLDYDPETLYKNLREAKAKDIYELPIWNKILPHREQILQMKHPKHIQTQNIPHCPICQSTDLSKITTTKKVAKIAAFGIFGMGDNGKTWKCNNCGSKF